MKKLLIIALLAGISSSCFAENLISYSYPTGRIRITRENNGKLEILLMSWNLKSVDKVIEEDCDAEAAPRRENELEDKLRSIYYSYYNNGEGGYRVKITTRDAWFNIPCGTTTFEKTKY